MLLSLHPNITVHVEREENKLELEQNQFDHYTHPHVPTVYASEFLVAFIWCLCKKYESLKYPGITFMYVWYMYQYSYLVEQVEVLLSQFEWNSRDSPTETRLTDR